MDLCFFPTQPSNKPQEGAEELRWRPNNLVTHHYWPFCSRRIDGGSGSCVCRWGWGGVKVNHEWVGGRNRSASSPLCYLWSRTHRWRSAGVQRRAKLPCCKKKRKGWIKKKRRRKKKKVAVEASIRGVGGARVGGRNGKVEAEEGGEGAKQVVQQSFSSFFAPPTGSSRPSCVTPDWLRGLRVLRLSARLGAARPPVCSSSRASGAPVGGSGATTGEWWFW